MLLRVAKQATSVDKCCDLVVNVYMLKELQGHLMQMGRSGFATPARVHAQGAHTLSYPSAIGLATYSTLLPSALQNNDRQQVVDAHQCNAQVFAQLVIDILSHQVPQQWQVLAVPLYWLQQSPLLSHIGHAL